MRGGVLRTGGGRIRLGWRLLLWAVAVLALALGTAILVPATRLPWVSLPLLVAGLGAGWLLLSLDGRPPGELGFRLSRSAPAEAGKGTALGVTVGLAAVAAMAAAGGVRWTGDEGSLAAWTAMGAAALWSLALPAAAEEALLRGYPLRALAEAWGGAVAVVLTSVTFALLHAANPDVGLAGLLNVAVAGVFLGALALRTGSLWWASGAHLGWNWAHAFLADLPVSGYELMDAPLLEPVLRGPSWVSGGRFGPEGSLVVTAVLAGAAAWTWRTRHLGPVPGAPSWRGASPPPEDRPGATGVLS
ncbi:MAG: CPBP family intramembrane metalloprotease [Gemmatimonadetes bacterium]|nr:CPBP family intramembrane metalloprotease [Gemmatimonadota bacterium]